jgi:cob(I)alamin adenosyltransferase
MTNRLTRITTRTGDDGTSALADGSRQPKHAPVFVALGDVDELNSALGVAMAHGLPDKIALIIAQIQNDLFDLGAEIAWPGHQSMVEGQLASLDEHIANFNALLPPLKEFVLPGGSLAGSQLQLARAVCRRAERAVALLVAQKDCRVDSLTGRYLNRLSDLLFILARTANSLAAMSEPTWRKRAR